MGREVVITGLGTVSCFGVGLEAFWRGLVEGRRGYGHLDCFSTAGVPEPVGCRVRDFNPEQYLGKKGLRQLDRNTLLLLTAAHLALSGMSAEELAELGLVIGTSFGSLSSIYGYEIDINREGPNLISPVKFPNTVLNSPASRVNIAHNLTAYSCTICNGSTAGLDALGYAFRAVRRGDYAAFLAGGGDELNQFIFMGYHSLSLLPGQGRSSAAPEKGVPPGEGACLLVLEEEARANGKRRPAFARIRGYENCFGEDGLERAISYILDKTGVEPREVNLVVVSAVGTRPERREVRALRNILGRQGCRPAIFAPKGAVGECYGAGGPLQVTAAIMAMREGMVPPSAYLPADYDDFDCGGGRLQKKEINYALITSVGCDGINSALLLQKCC
ncbi:beta-ketoacyl-[acyl-carrier-protein] synthase family protein [Desulfotomaculum copahuensis]|uniref:Ketosynthase family 3 (KS3) domain-containing protein n=1 Tax=Desulfotomaculum copahuensis TaxID=1838280 RepID=A0A1B7LFY9_9FIRM|nr:beta-ketoacyl synthase N-terminal-like domain-containing protein [Desulfotomaculum copahuensis]OAT83620.1 hypothetical protein A6M21_08020 [Desulfotomaculum copahuensis]